MATAGAFGLTARSVILHHPASFPLVTGYLGGYIALILAGVATPRLGMWGEALCDVPRGHGVALTFDDGPDPEHTPRVLEVLAHYQTKATFFVIGEKVERYPETARAIVRAGHEIGSHGFRCDRWLSLRSLNAVRDDLEQSVRRIEQVTGVRPTLFRPPYGLLNPRFFRVVDELDLDVIAWSVRALDGLARTTANDIVRRVVPHLRDGAIVCLHDAAERSDRTPVVVDALPRLFAALAARNLPAVTVTKLRNAR